MYRIVVDGNVVQDSVNNVVINPRLKEKSSGVPTLEYSIPYNDPHYDDYKELMSVVQVFNGESLIPEFQGRLLTSRPNFGGFKELLFEGDLSLLNDIQFPPFEHHGSVAELVQKVIVYYNQNCSFGHEILLGNVTVEDPNDYILRSSDGYMSCLQVLEEKLVNMLDGYLMIRYVRLENGKFERYLDYLSDCGECSQTIEFGVNLLDLERYIDASKVATVLIARGAQAEDGTRITTTVETEFATHDKFGRIEVVHDWDDVTELENLQTKAEAYASEMILKDTTITAKAVDLHFTDAQLEEFKINKRIQLTSTPHGLNVAFVCNERERALNNPSQDVLTLGTAKKTFTSDVVNRDREISDNVVDKSTVNGMIEHQTEILLGGNGGYKYEVRDDTGAVRETYYMDTPNIETAVNVLRINNQGIGFSVSGIKGPFVTAWTIDGSFNANFIKGGKIEGVEIIGRLGKIGAFNINDDYLGFEKTLEFDFTQADLTTVENIIANHTEPTAEQISRYDINGDGRITTLDYVLIEQIMANGNKNKITYQISPTFNHSNEPIIRITNEIGGDFQVMPSGAVVGYTMLTNRMECNNLYIGGHSSPVGTIITCVPSSTSDLTLNDTNGHSVCSVKLPQGTWLIRASVRVMNTTDNKMVAANLSSESGSGSYYTRQYCHANSVTQLSFSHIQEITNGDGTTIHLNVITNLAGTVIRRSGGKLVTGFEAVRIA